MKKKIICIYHGGCDDGFGAAFAVRAKLGDDVEYCYGDYGRPPPDVQGREVIMVDFSYKRPVLEKIIRGARSVLILDHHETAKNELAGLDDPKRNVFIHFDTTRSGAGMAWDYYHPKVGRPKFIEYIEARDLWQKDRLPNVDYFTFGLRSYPQSFPAWDQLFGDQAWCDDPASFLISIGEHVGRYVRLQCEVLKKLRRKASIGTPFGNVYCNVVNAPHAFASEVAGEIITNDVEFGACFFMRADGDWQYNLRSRGTFSVEKVAKHYGGGGHVKAAGFQSKQPVHLYV